MAVKRVFKYPKRRREEIEVLRDEVQQIWASLQENAQDLRDTIERIRAERRYRI